MPVQGRNNNSLSIFSRVKEDASANLLFEPLTAITQEDLQKFLATVVKLRASIEKLLAIRDTPAAREAHAVLTACIKILSFDSNKIAPPVANNTITTIDDTSSSMRPGQ